MPAKPGLLLAAEGSGNFAQHFVLLLPARLKSPREDLLELAAVVHGGMKKDNVGPFFGSTYFILQSGMPLDRQRDPSRRWRVLHFLHHAVTRQSLILI